MTFLFPWGLLGLLTLPLIVYLHLRREKLRRITVPSLFLWQLLPQIPEGQRKQWLPLTFLLFLHLGVATLLGLALSQPQWLGQLLGQEQHLALIIDTSTSMKAQDGDSTRLEQARRKAQELANGLGPQSTFALITAGPQPHLLTSGNATNRGQFFGALDKLQAEGIGTDIAGALTLAQVALQSFSQGKQIVVLSDLDQPSSLFQLVRAEDKVEWQRVGNKLENHALVAFAAQPRNQKNRAAGYTVYARVVNYSDSSLSTGLRLYADDNLLDTQMVDVQPQGETDFTWTLPSNFTSLRADLGQEDALPADNLAYLSLTPSRPLKTTLVSEASEPLIKRALNAIPDLKLTVVQPAAYDANLPTDLTIFDGLNQAPAKWPVGGVLVLAPPQSIFTSTTLLSWTNVISSAGNLFEGLNLASFTPQGKVLPRILRRKLGQSEIALWDFNLTQGNLTTKLAFPLLVARTVHDLTPSNLPSSLLAGEAFTFRPSPHTESVQILSPSAQTTSLATESAQAIWTSLAIEGLPEPGIYTLAEMKGKEVLFQGQIAVNVGAALESNLQPRPMEVVLNPPPAKGSPTAQLPPDASSNPSLHAQQHLWPLLAFAALGFLTFEWVYVALGQRKRPSQVES